MLDNLVLSAEPRRGPFFDRPAAESLADRLIRQLRIKAPTSSVRCRDLSGGNLQKVVLGKCLAPRPRLMLLDNPTRGVDVGARAEIYRVIRALADGGMAVLLLSEDLPELLGLSDRIVVMRRGGIAGTFPTGARPSEAEVIQRMV